MTFLPFELLRAVDAANISIARLGVDECFQDLNQAAEAIFGRRHGELKGKHWREIIHPEDHARVKQAYAASLDGSHGFIEARGLHGDGSIRYLAITVTRIADAEGNPKGFLC